MCKPLPTKYLVIQGGFKTHKCFRDKVYNLFLQSSHLLSVVLVWETVLIKKIYFLLRRFFLSVSNEIPVRPDFVFCIQVFSAQLTKEDGMNLYFQRKQSYHISPCLSCKELCFYSAIKSEQSLILYNTFVFTLQFQANKIFEILHNKEQSYQATTLKQNFMLIVYRRFNHKKEHDSIIPGLWFAKFQVHHKRKSDVDRRFNPTKNTTL